MMPVRAPRAPRPRGVDADGPHHRLATHPATRLARTAQQRVSGRSLAAVRIAVGSVGVLSAVRIVRYGWIDQLYAGPPHRFTYLGFGWVPQPSPATMTGIVAAMGAASLALALGWRTRPAGVVLLIAFAWTELIDVTTYLNHYWFLTLVLTLGLVVPWGAALSLDARRRGERPVALGWVWLLRFQIGIVYASAGVAKLQGDWLLRAEPLRLWLPPRADLPLVGWAMEEASTAHLLSVAGAAFDCAIVPLLLWKRTRPWAWPVLVAFHISTWALFPIGVFPWLMIGASTAFFAPDWPSQLAARATTRFARGHGTTTLAPQPWPGPGTTQPIDVEGSQPARARRRWLTAAAAMWVAVQVAMPLRHLAYATDDHRWSGQGYRFAWNVLLVEKAGSVTFLIHDPATGRTRATDGAELYDPAQIQVMATDPDLIHQAALALADAAGGDERIEVRVDAWMSINGGPPARLIDPAVDLAAERRDPWNDPWILPRPR